MTTAHPPDAALIAFGRDQLPAAEAAAVRHHLDGCEACRRRPAGGDTNPAGGTDVHGGLSQAARNLSDMPVVDRVPDELTGLTQYADLKELGRGGMGVVYLARHTLLDRPVVLKVASRALLARAGRDAAERFLREMRSAAKLGHPNVVAAYDAFRHGDVLVFVMEYAHGEDLARVLARKGRLPVPTACFYAHCVALGLQHAHAHGLVHRDIKPANLIQVKTGNKAVVKVLDFGLAKVSREAGGSGPTLANMGIGTPQYMAPEQWKDAGGVGIRADIYSLGCTLYYLLTGEPPFHGNQFQLMVAHCHTPAPAVRDLRPDVPGELSAVVAKMLAKDPADRFQTPAEVAKALVPFTRRTAANPARAAEPTPAAVVADPPVREVAVVHGSARTATAIAPEPRLRWVWPAVAAVALLVGLLAGVVFKVKTPHGTLSSENEPADADPLGRRLTECLAQHRREATALRQAGLRLFDERGKLPKYKDSTRGGELAAERQSYMWIGDLPDWVPMPHVAETVRVRQSAVTALEAVLAEAKVQGRVDVERAASAELEVVSHDPSILMRWDHQVWSHGGDSRMTQSTVLNLHANTGMTPLHREGELRKPQELINRWEFASPAILVVRWKNWGYTDTVTIDLDGMSFSGTNNLGNVTIRGRRLPIRPVRLPDPPP